MAKYVKPKGKGQGGAGKIEKDKKSGGHFKSKKRNSSNNVGKKDAGAGRQKKNFVQKKKKVFIKKKSNFKSENQDPKKIKEDGGPETEKGLKRKVPPNKEDDEVKKSNKKEGDPMVARLMSIYELLRKKNTSKDDKHKLIDEVIKFISDKEIQVVFKHDTVRVLEFCMKCGSTKQREFLFELFKEKTILLATSKYSKFLVEKFMEYGTKEQKTKLIKSFYGKVGKLIKHKGAADILEELYVRHANSSQRAALVEEFYGPEFAVFKVATGQTFEDMMEKEAAKKKTVMNYMKSEFLNLCQKDMILHSITHRALYEFFKHADESQKLEVREVLKERIIHILHTKDGAKVAMNCLWLGTTKDRKAILKTFKTYVLKICKEEFGHLVMLALFDVVDDTVLVKKIIFPEILTNLEDIMANQYGRKVILYLLKPRSNSYFLPDITKLLEQGDNNTYSKKDAAVRQGELRSFILPELLKVTVPHVDDIIKNKSVAIVLLAALECAEDSPQLCALMEKIVNLISKPLERIEKDIVTENDSSVDAGTNDTTNEDHPICHACGHWVIKSIIQKDKVRIENGSEMIFSKMICDAVPIGCFVDWAMFNRGAFVLVSLLETGVDSVTKRVREDLLLIPKDTKSQSTSKGFELLMRLMSTD